MARSYDTIVSELGRASSERAASDAAAAVAGAGAMLTWGNVAFAAPGHAYDELRRTTAHRHPAIARIGTRPARQGIGAGDDTVRLSGIRFPARYRARLVDELRTAILSGQPGLLTTGAGDVLGEWVGLSLDEVQTRAYADGSPRRVTWTLDLAHVGTDTPTGRADATESRVAARLPAARMTAAVETAAAATSATPESVRSVVEQASRGLPGDSFLLRALDAARQASLSDNASVRGVVDAVRRSLFRSAGASPKPAVPTLAYRASEGDTVDRIAWLRYGGHATEAVLAATPGLAALGPRLPAGTLVGLPNEVSGTAAASSSAGGRVELWD